MAKRGWRSANLSPDRRIFFSQGRGGVHSRELASRLVASFGSRGGASRADLLFPLLFPPTVISVTPTSGSATGGTVVAIAGLNFRTGAVVTFGGLSATAVVVNGENSIACTTPAHAVGAVNVQVTNSDGQFGLLVNGYTYIQPVIVAVGGGGGVAARSLNGTTWAAKSIPTGEYIGVAWNAAADLFLALDSTGKTATSPDGDTWTLGASLPATNNLRSIAAGLGLFVAVGTDFGGSTARIFTSPDGVNWTSRAPPAGSTAIGKVIFDGTRFVGCNGGGPVRGFLSNNGISWSGTDLDFSNWRAITGNGSFYIAFDQGSLKCAYSSNGLNYTNTAFPAAGSSDATPFGPLFCVANNTFNTGYYGSDGIHWSTAVSQISAESILAVPSIGIIVAVGSVASSSPDGINWVTRTIPAGLYKALALKP